MMVVFVLSNLWGTIAQFIEILECLRFALLTNTGKRNSMNGKR